MERTAGEVEIEGPRYAHAGPVLLDAGEDTGQAPIPMSRPRRWGWLETAVLAGYAAVVAAGIAWHEPWADEAQAWLLGRDNSWWNLIMHRIRYEGSPGLWHTIMWLLARMHVGYAGMHWVSGLIALAGIAAFLLWAPFPPILKILFPFGFWLAYQDAVVARSYVVFAVLAFPAAALLRRATVTGLTRGKLFGLAILLGLMANVSVHGFVASLGFALAAVALWRRQSRTAPIRIALPAALLCCFWIFVVVTVFPPSDVDFPAGRNLQLSAQKIWASLGSKTAKAELLEEKMRGAEPRPGELPMLTGHAFQKTPGEARWHKIARILSLITYPVSNFRFLALAACILVIAQAIVFRPARGQLGWIGLMPWVLMVLVFTWMYLAPRHAGMLWEAFLAALWLTWPAEPIASGHAVWLRRLTIAALVLVALNQVQWTLHSTWDDIHKPYAGDEETANWLKANAAGKRVAGFAYHSVGITAWFDRPIYFNQPTTYWIWAQGPRIDARAPFTIAKHPDVIVVGGWNWSEHNADITEDWIRPSLSTLWDVPLNDAFRIIPYAEAHGYRETHRFCGHAFMRSGYSEELCDVVLQPDPGYAPPSADRTQPGAE